MNASIEFTAASLSQVCDRQVLSLEGKSVGELRDLIHDCESLPLTESWSVRTAAEINRIVARAVLEKRASR